MPLDCFEENAHIEADFGLHPDALAALWQMEESHFWHQARNGWILNALKKWGCDAPSTFLEVGCGAGWVACALHRAGYQVTGLDTARILVDKAVSRCPEVTFLCGNLAHLPLKYRGPYDAVGLFDVLEHLDEPIDLIKMGMRFAKPGALVIATAPAMQSLYSVIDDLTMHKRRFEPGEMAECFRQTGLKDVREFGLFRIMAFVQKRFRRRFPKDDTETMSAEEKVQILKDNFRTPNPLVNQMLGAVCRLELSLGWRRAEGKKGASVMAVGRVPC